MCALREDPHIRGKFLSARRIQFNRWRKLSRACLRGPCTVAELAGGHEPVALSAPPPRMTFTDDANRFISCRVHPRWTYESDCSRTTICLLNAVTISARLLTRDRFDGL